MVTAPVLDEGPELAVAKCPDPVLTEKATVAPETARFFASTTVAVIVAVVEPSALIEAADEERMTAAGGPTMVVVVVELTVVVDVVVTASPPPALHPCTTSAAISHVAERNALTRYVSMVARLGTVLDACVFRLHTLIAGHQPWTPHLTWIMMVE